MKRRLSPWVYYIVALFCALVGAYMFLWTVSSSSLALAYCDGDFALDAAIHRCRTPAIVSAIFVISSVLAVGFLVIGLYMSRNR